jgi:predicted nucleotidyltransferase
VEDKIDIAFVYGSFASGDYGNNSDIDLFVVSDLSGVKLAELLGPVQNETNRAINTSQFTPTEYNQRKQGNDHFLTQVLNGPRIVIIGDMNES